MIVVARQALNQRDMAGAERILQDAEAQCAGNEVFDSLLGGTLLANGHAEAASWVLARAVMVNPQHGAAWLDLAEVSLFLGELDRAQQALNHANALHPPPLVRRRIAALQAILQRKVRPWSFNGYIATEMGWDSNVNAATNLSSIMAPGISSLPINLDADSRQKSSRYADVELGGTLAWQLNNDLTLYLLPKVKSRSFLPLHQFDRGIFDAQGGIGWRLGRGLLMGLLQLESQKLGGSDYLHSEGGTLQWRQPLLATAQLSLASQWLRTRYADPAMRYYDNDQLLFGASLTEAFWRERLHWTWAAYQGQDDGVNNRVGGRRRMLILSSDLGYQPRSDLDFHLVLTHESDAYQDVDPSFLQVRNESTWSYTVDMAWQWRKHHTLTAGYSVVRDDANIPLYANNRQIASVGWRVAF